MGADGAMTAGKRLDARRQIVLAANWFALSFQGGALLGVAVPAHLLRFGGARATTLLAILGGCSGLLTMLVQPIAGVLSDLSESRWGRRRPYLLGGAALNVAGLLLMARATAFVPLFIAFMIATFGNSVSGAAYQAYVPDQVPPEQYGEASGYLGAMSMLGTIVSFGVAALLVGPGQAAPFYGVNAALIAAGAAITALAIPDPPTGRAPRPIVQSRRALWLDPWRHPDFTLVFATRAMMMLALYTLFTFVTYYVRDVVHVTRFVQGAAAIAGVATCAALVGGVITGILSDSIGRRAPVTVASALMAAALAGLAFIHQLAAVLGFGVVFGLALGAYMAVDWALAIDVLPDAGFAAKDLGLWGISTNLPQMAAPFLGGLVLALLTPLGADVGYGALFVVAALCAAASGALIWRVRGAR